MSKDDVIEAEGKVIEALPNATFKVQLSNGHTITAYISGKLRMNYIRIIEGDNVKLEMVFHHCFLLNASSLSAFSQPDYQNK